MKEKFVPIKRPEVSNLPPLDMPNFMDTVMNNGIAKLHQKIDAAVKDKLLECGYGDWDTVAKYHAFLKEHVTMCNFDSGELSEIWVDYGTDDAVLICTMENKFDVENNEGSITFTYR